MDYKPTKSGKRWIGDDGGFYYKCVCQKCGDVVFGRTNKTKFCISCRSIDSSERQKHSYEFVKEQMEKEGYTLLSKEYQNNNTKLKVQCSEGHIYYPIFSNFSRGERCLYCRKNAPIFWKDVMELFKLKDWKVLSKENEWKGAYKDKIKFQCKNGHVWQCTYTRLKHRFDTTGCPICNNNLPIKFEDIKNWFEEEDWVVYTEEKDYRNQNGTPIDCSCPKGHRQLKNVRRWRMGRRCLYCINSGPEIEVGKYINKIYKETVINNDRKVLSGLELDFYFPLPNKAIEFNGDYWHCNPKSYGPDYLNKHKGKYAKDLWEIDDNKKTICNELNIDLLTIWESNWMSNNKECKKEINKFLED